MNKNIWAREVADQIKKKMLVVAARSGGKIPYTTKNGVFDDWTEKNICWWTNGFWGGIMWQLYHATGQEVYKNNAIDNEVKLDRNLMLHQGMDHDSGFKWLTTAVANYRKSGNQESWNRGMLAADNLAGRFNLAGKFIRAWNDDGNGDRAGWAIIDCMMNLPLLYWAYKQTNDPRYLHIAISHADTTIEHFIREDGSVKHIVEFDPMTGEYIRSHGGQGCEDGSSWTRGQAWAIYGFVLSYIHTQNIKYLESAKKIANYYIKNIPENGLIPVDFRQPKDCKLEDSTAAAIAACGLLEIAKLMEDRENNKYYEAAIKLLQSLAKQRCNWSDDCDNILEKCTAAFHDQEHEFSIIYGDYFFIEAIWKLTGEELFIW
ncbi:MAG TPA: glycosyl hydrolase family 88 [Clostridiales bacterium]|nr:glycosyl hydrolase family 88 [Clostridiales bacterium]